MNNLILFLDYEGYDDYDYGERQCHSAQHRIDSDSFLRCEDGIECTVGRQCGAEGNFNLQVILFEIDCAIFYTNLNKLFCQLIN